MTTHYQQDQYIFEVSRNTVYQTQLKQLFISLIYKQ